jgi:hypothetical protein
MRQSPHTPEEAMRNKTWLRTVACYGVMSIALAMIFVELRSGVSPIYLIFGGAFGYYTYQVRASKRIVDTVRR